MRVPEWRPTLTAAHDAALEWLEHLAERPVRPEVDYDARMRPDALADALAGIEGPAIVCAQAGEIATGGIDPLAAIADVVDARRDHAPTWLHVDGAIGLLARASSVLGPRFAVPSVPTRGAPTRTSGSHAVRLRDRDRPRPGGAPSGDDAPRVVPAATQRSA